MSMNYGTEHWLFSAEFAFWNAIICFVTVDVIDLLSIMYYPLKLIVRGIKLKSSVNL